MISRIICWILSTFLITISVFQDLLNRKFKSIWTIHKTICDSKHSSYWNIAFVTTCWYETCSCLLKHKKMLHGVVTVAIWSPFMQKWLDYWKMGHLKYDWPKWMLTKRKTLPQSSTWAVFPLLNSSKMEIGKMPPIFLVMHLFVWCICKHDVIFIQCVL